MSRNYFDLVCLFGFSPHFEQISAFLDDSNIKCIVTFSPRQKDSVEALNLSKSVLKLCEQNLDDVFFEKTGIRNSKSLGISFGSPFIFKQKDIDAFNGNLVNSHGAPLPAFKGGGGFSWRILQGDKRGAALMHFVSTKIDEGACVFRKDFLFSEEERLPRDLEERQIEEESKHLVPWICKVALGEIDLSKSSCDKKADLDSGSYFPRLSTDLHGCINWSLSLKDLESFIWAFSSPYQGAYTYIKGHKARIMDAHIVEKKHMHPFTYGLIINADEEGYLVSCNGGVISIKRKDLHIKTSEFRINCGDRLYTPADILQRALSSRAFYKPNGLDIRDYALISEE